MVRVLFATIAMEDDDEWVASTPVKKSSMLRASVESGIENAERGGYQDKRDAGGGNIYEDRRRKILVAIEYRRQHIGTPTNIARLPLKGELELWGRPCVGEFECEAMQRENTFYVRDE